jgi:hypothetical protein
VCLQCAQRAENGPGTMKPRPRDSFSARNRYTYAHRSTILGYLFRASLDVGGLVSRAVCGVTHQPVGRAESVGCGIKSMPNPPYISVVANSKSLWLVTLMNIPVVRRAFTSRLSPARPAG